MGSSNAVADLADQIVSNICGSGLRSATNWQPARILNKFIFEAASKFVDQFATVPQWIPGYKEWADGEIPFFVYTRISEEELLAQRRKSKENRPDAKKPVKKPLKKPVRKPVPKGKFKFKKQSTKRKNKA